MNFKQLRAFREVMLTGSVSEAARRLFRSQPAISALIGSLEKDIGFKLFIRKDMRLQPVPEAHYLLHEVSLILDHLDNTRSTMQGIRKLGKGVLRIASMPGPAVVFLPHIVERFLGDRHDIKISLISKTSPQVIRLIAAQQYAIGFADYEAIDHQDEALVSHELFEFSCICAVPKDSPLAKKTLITPQDLSGVPLITLLKEHSLTLDTQRVFESEDSHFNAMYEAQYFLQLFVFIEKNKACGIVDKLSAESYRLLNQADDLSIVFRPFSYELSLKSTLMTPAHSPLSSIADEFLKTLQQELSAISNTPN